MSKLTMDLDVLDSIVDSVDNYRKSKIKVVDTTVPSVVHCVEDEQCLIHVVSLPKTPDKLFVLCHHSNSAADAADRLSECLEGYLGFLPEVKTSVKNRRYLNDTLFSVVGFYVDREENETPVNVQFLSN